MRLQPRRSFFHPHPLPHPPTLCSTHPHSPALPLLGADTPIPELVINRAGGGGGSRGGRRRRAGGQQAARGGGFVRPLPWRCRASSQHARTRTQTHAELWRGKVQAQPTVPTARPASSLRRRSPCTRPSSQPGGKGASPAGLQREERGPACAGVRQRPRLLSLAARREPAPAVVSGQWPGPALCPRKAHGWPVPQPPPSDSQGSTPPPPTAQPHTDLSLPATRYIPTPDP